MALSWTMDKIGVLARSADDCGLVLAAIAGPDPEDPTTLPEPWRYVPAAAEKRFRLGVVAKAWEKMDPEVPATFDAALQALRKMATLEEVSLPDLPFGAAAGTLIT